MNKTIPFTLHDDLLWVSYYASHEGKTSSSLGKVKVVAK